MGEEMKKLLVLFCCLFFTACVHSKPPVARDAPNDNTAVLTLMNSIGDELGDFKRNECKTRDYETRAPGLGYSKRYETSLAPIFIDVYAFNMRIADLPDGIDSDQFASVYSQNLNVIKAFYKDEVHNVREERITYKGIEFKNAKLFISNRNNDDTELKPNRPLTIYNGTTLNVEELKSNLFLTIYNGVILKVRISYSPQKVTENTDKLITAFMEALAADITRMKK